MPRGTEKLGRRPAPPAGVGVREFTATGLRIPWRGVEQAGLGLLGTGVGACSALRPSRGPRLLLPAGQPDLCGGGLPAGAGAEPAGRGRQPAHGPAAGEDGLLRAEEQVRAAGGPGLGGAVGGLARSHLLEPLGQDPMLSQVCLLNNRFSFQVFVKNSSLFSEYCYGN